MEWVYWTVGGYLVPTVLCYLLTRKAIIMGLYAANLEALLHCITPGVNIIFTLYFCQSLPKYASKKTFRKIFLLKD
ncbi:putative membrane-bound protein [Bacillus phage vB_BsuM-Goe9]|nr:putative membrane-bound protein [Bacillus phage vB_BsuM-Goe9]